MNISTRFLKNCYECKIQYLLSLIKSRMSQRYSRPSQKKKQPPNKIFHRPARALDKIQLAIKSNLTVIAQLTPTNFTRTVITIVVYTTPGRVQLKEIGRVCVDSAAKPNYASCWREREARDYFSALIGLAG